MKTLLIYHEDDMVDRELTTRWLASFSNLVGIVVLSESRGRFRKRVHREIKRVGILRFFDVMAFRFYYKFFLSSTDERWKQEMVSLYSLQHGGISETSKIFATSPNANEVINFVRSHEPDIMIARCKSLLKPELFSLPKLGTYVLHPGICPEYRNAHGCFWALANADYEKVGLTLLKIDEGVDTGPIYGHYTYDYDALTESHQRIQNKVFTENLDELKKKFIDIYSGTAETIDVSGRESRTWGQPWLTAYFKMRRDLRHQAQPGERESELDAIDIT